MHEKLVVLCRAIEVALILGRPAMEAAIFAWEGVNSGSRAGLNAALLQLADQGVIQGQVVADRRSDRRVLRIVAITTEVQPMENIEQNRKVFVVHGRDDALRKAMFDFLRSINLHPMEWHELTADSGTGTPYIGAVLDMAFQQAQAVVVMLTPDEDVQLSPRLGGGEAGSQARPNVLFEAGLALARNPTRTIIVEIGSMRPFSDIAGRHVVRLDDSLPNAVAKRQDLAQRLQVAGCNVSLRGTDWHSAGLFRAI